MLLLTYLVYSLMIRNRTHVPDLSMKEQTGISLKWSEWLDFIRHNRTKSPFVFKLHLTSISASALRSIPLRSYHYPHNLSSEFFHFILYLNLFVFCIFFSFTLSLFYSRSTALYLISWYHFFSCTPLLCGNCII